MVRKSIRFLPPRAYFKGKRVVMRVDFNVDLEGDKIINDFRIRRTLPTIQYVSPRAKSLLLLSHRGSFEKPNNYSQTLQPIAQHLAKLLKREVYFVTGPLDTALSCLQNIPQHSIVLLENIRWYKGERQNSLALAKELAKGADVFINDAFGESHRKEASLVAITKYLPSFAGITLESEMRQLTALQKNPLKPFVVVLGGIKLKTKFPLLKDFVRRADSVLLGGGLATTLLAASGKKMGKSLYDKDFIPKAKQLLLESKVVLPRDYAVGTSLKQKKRVVKTGDLLNSEYLLDIGSRTQADFIKILKQAVTIFWSGPMGYVENPAYKQGSERVARAILNNKRAQRVIGGGDTLELLKMPLSHEFADSRLFLSTGGGAMLAYLAGEKLPGIEALRSNR